MFKQLVFVAVLAAVASAAPLSLEKRLIAFDEEGPRMWMTEMDIINLYNEQPEVNFVDVTDFKRVKRSAAPHSFPSTPQLQHLVEPLIAELSPANLSDTIAGMQEFHTRYYTQPSALEAARWLGDRFTTFAGPRINDDVSVTLFEHSFGVQPTVIASIRGTEFPDEIVVVGAHEDSIAGLPTNRAPGADDDASGIANAVDVFRVFMENGFRPRRTIEFMGYAAEEVGLRGSQDVAQTYAEQGKDVVAVYQCEMSGYVGNSNTIAVIDDSHTHDELTQFIMAVITEYCDIDFRKSVCGYGCSDHASWTAQDYPAICVAEAGPFDGANPNMHTANDLLSELDMEYSNESSKAALAFAVELSMADL